MKLTKTKLKRIIKEELQVVLNEQSIDARGRQQFRNYSGQNYALDYQNGWKNKLAELGTNQDEVKKAIRALERGEKQFINKRLYTMYKSRKSFPSRQNYTKIRPRKRTKT